MVGAAAVVNLVKDAAKGEIHSISDGLGSLGKGAVTGLLGAAGGAVGGFIAGKAMSVLGPMAMSLGGRMLGGALAGGVGDAATQLASGQPVDLGSVALSAGIGAAFGGFYKGGGKGKGEEADADGAPAGSSCPFTPGVPHSFDAHTRVLMADGSTKPIKDITIGDKVKATDPATGKTDAKPVTKLYLNRDHDLTKRRRRRRRNG
jgi:large repetitive protein